MRSGKVDVTLSIKMRIDKSSSRVKDTADAARLQAADKVLIARFGTVPKEKPSEKKMRPLSLSKTLGSSMRLSKMWSGVAWSGELTEAVAVAWRHFQPKGSRCQSEPSTHTAATNILNNGETNERTPSANRGDATATEKAQP